MAISPLPESPLPIADLDLPGSIADRTGPWPVGG